jgi:DNA-binding NarL/FixJ family response regulator
MRMARRRSSDIVTPRLPRDPSGADLSYTVQHSESLEGVRRPRTCRLVLVAEAGVIRDALRVLLDSSGVCTVVAARSPARGLRCVLHGLRPDVVIVVMTGKARRYRVVTACLNAMKSKTHALIITEDERRQDDVSALGASTIVPVTEPGDLLIASVMELWTRNAAAARTGDSTDRPHTG